MIQKGFVFHERGWKDFFFPFTLERFRTMYVNIEENHTRVLNIWNPYLLFYVLEILKRIWPFEVTFLLCNSNLKCIIK